MSLISYVCFFLSLQVTHWPKADYGKFYDGDSYIILNTYRKDPSSPVSNVSGCIQFMLCHYQALSWDVHFWIGKYSTQDEYGTAAYKTVELDHFVSVFLVSHQLI